MTNATKDAPTKTKESDPSLSFVQVFDAHKVKGFKPFQVEFKFPDAGAFTYVLARRHWKGGIEVGMPVESRGGKVYNYTRLENTQFNLARCTGRVKPFNSF